MSKDFKSLEECLITLESSGKENLIHLYLRKNGVKYDLIKNVEKLVPVHRLRGYQSLLKYILESIKENKEIYFGYNPDFPQEIYSFEEKESLGVVYFGSFSVVQNPGRGRPLPTIEFEDGTLCSKYQDYLEFFRLPDNYFNRGKVMRWVNAHQEKVKVVKKKVYHFNPQKVIGFTTGTTRFKTEVQVLSYKGLPDMFGFGAIIKTFPKLTQIQVEDLYKSHGVKIPSTVGKYFRDKEKDLSTKVVKSKTTNTKVELGEFDYYIDTYQLRPSESPGYMSFRSNYGDIVIDTPEKLTKELREHEEVITANEAKRLWSIVMGGD